MLKVLVTDKVHPHLINELQENNYEVEYLPSITHSETLEIISDYFGIIINSKTKANKEFLDKATNLKFIGRLGSGLEIIDLAYAAEKGVKVYNSPEGNRNAVAEHAVGMILSLFNKLRKADQEVRRLHWDRESNRGLELEGKTIGIIGFGNTGSQLAKKLAGWEMNILAFDKYKSGFGDDRVSETTMEEILSDADIISFHLPLTTETSGLLNETFLNRIEKEVFIINTSRGKVIETKTLLKALETGKVKGACLDVFENEKVETFTEEEKEMYEQLYKYDNVIVSPHVAGWTQESLFKIASTLIKKINTDF